MSYRNTDVMSRLAEKLTDKIGDMGSDKPVYVSLWSDDRAPTTLWDHFWSMLGRFNSKEYTSLTVHYSAQSGFTLEGATWRQINRRLGWSITELAREVVTAVTTEYQLTRGWEVSLEETLAELDGLEL
jgi:hypothetical protein